MTTLVALATKDAVVMGCDSLATSSRMLVDPVDLIGFFDHQNGWELRRKADGSPMLTFDHIVERSSSIPYNHMTDVDKLLNLAPLPMGAMFTGITSIGDRTIKSLISEFNERNRPRKGTRYPKNFTVEGVAGQLLDHFAAYYEQEFAHLEHFSRPGLEFLMAGYDEDGPLPKVFRVNVARKTSVPAIDGFGIAFGGQMAEIQRIVFGADWPSRVQLEERHRQLLEKYVAHLRKLNGTKLKVPDPEAHFTKYLLFGPLDPDDPQSPTFQLPAFDANWGDFSEQNAIDCVAFFIGIMREAHRFSQRMPTVGGSIHVALIRREDGFRFISREEYRHEDHRVRRVSEKSAG